MEELTEVITAAEFHPHQCNTFVYSSSKGTIRLCDMRMSALCDKHSKCEYLSLSLLITIHPLLCIFKFHHIRKNSNICVWKHKIQQSGTKKGSNKHQIALKTLFSSKLCHSYCNDITLTIAGYHSNTATFLLLRVFQETAVRKIVSV